MKVRQNIVAVHDPLSLTTNLEVRGGAIKQTLVGSEFVPNRVLTPLTLIPKVSIFDPSGLMQNGTTQTINHRWYAGTEAEANRIENNADYNIKSDGSLVVKKNVAVNSPLVLIYKGAINDTRTQKGVEVSMQQTLTTTTSVGGGAALKLDKGDLIKFDPLQGLPKLTVSGQLFLGEKAQENIITTYKWYRVDNNVESVITEENSLFVEKIEDSKITVDSKYINRVTIRCRATQRNSKGITAEAYADIVVMRRYGVYVPEIVNIEGAQVRRTTKRVRNKLLISTNKNPLTNPERFFEIKWLGKSSKAGSVERVIGYGEFCEVSPDVVKDGYYNIDADIQEKKALQALMDGGKVLTENGKILVG